MPSLAELVEGRVQLTNAMMDQLEAIISDWQILADLSFADLLMFCRDATSDEFVVVAQLRPYTAQTVYQEDLVGQTRSRQQRPTVARAFDEGRISRDGEADWAAGIPVREEAIPVLFDDQVVAVVTREANLSMVRSPSRLELAYLQTADILSEMLSEGSFPFPGEEPERELAPRVGDGLIRLGPDGEVTYASPNAISAYRRLGVNDNVVGSRLDAFDLDDKGLLEALADGEPLESEVEARGAVVLRRLIPLTRQAEVLGGLMLSREVTELRRHEKMLRYKDAAIREIHHRVKNNLQTVASLLRLQGRRLKSPEAQDALMESERRIASIALVHETLAQGARQRVPFDRVAERLAAMLTSSLADPGRPITVSMVGYAGELPAEVATPLALVLSEVIQNAVEHAFPNDAGTITIRLERQASRMRMLVNDDGVGIPDGWSIDKSANLGLRIAKTLVESELGGHLAIDRGADGGTSCVADLPLR